MTREMEKLLRRLLPATIPALLTLAPLHTAWAKPPAHVIGPNFEYALPGPDTKPGAEVSSSSLVENAGSWNGKIISFTGEAVGERLSKGSMAWIHLNDDAYMWKNIEEGAVLGGYNTGQAVWVSEEWARKITYFGDYKHEGDVVRVTGTFNAACRQHGGDMDIHAGTLDIVRPGHLVGHVVNVHRAGAAAVLFALSGLLWWFRRVAERRRV